MANHNFVLGGNTIQNAPGVVVSDNVNDYYAPFTDDATATADEILEGYTAYGASGEKLTGTASGGGGGGQGAYTISIGNNTDGTKKLIITTNS